MKGHCVPAYVSSPSLRFRRTPLRAALALFGCLGGLLGGLTVLSGCTTGRGSSNVSFTRPTAKTLRQAMTSDPTTFDPALVEDGTTIDLLQQVFGGLVKWNEKNELVPDLAEKWDISADGKTYTFHLRKGVKFHNGREVTAGDFKYSLERACDPNSKSGTVLTYLNDIVGAPERRNAKASGSIPEISGVKVRDPQTLQITIDAAKSYWLSKMTYPTGYVVCKEAIEKNAGKLDEKAAVGTGPFKMSEYQRGYLIRLIANTDYYEGQPKLDAIVRPIIKEATTRLSKYEADELDIVDVAPSDLDNVNGNPKLKPDLRRFSRAAIWYVALNAAAPDSPFANKAVRQAFAMALDKGEVIRVALKNEAEIANGIVPPGVPGYNPNVQPIPYNPARAKQMLASAGYPDGKGFPALTLSFRQDMPQVAATAQVIARQLKTNLGIEVQLRPLEWATFLTERASKTMPLSHLRWAADYLDPQDFLSVLLHTSKKVNDVEDHQENGVGYSNPQFDTLCDQADVERDVARRIALYRKAEQIAVDDAPWVPLYFQKDLELVKPRVLNLRDSLFGHLPHVTTAVSP